MSTAALASSPTASSITCSAPARASAPRSRRQVPRARVLSHDLQRGLSTVQVAGQLLVLPAPATSTDDFAYAEKGMEGPTRPVTRRNRPDVVGRRWLRARLPRCD